MLRSSVLWNNGTQDLGFIGIRLKSGAGHLESFVESKTTSAGRHARTVNLWVVGVEMSRL